MPCRRRLISSLSLLLAGCSQPGAPAGTVIGTVLWSNTAAPGRTVELLTLNTTGDTWVSVDRTAGKYTVSTDAQGSYTFSGLKPGTYRVQYLSDPLLDSFGKIIGPNEVASWRTSTIDLRTGGAVIPPFDVAYNGLIFPDTEKKQLPSKDSPLPFFWATHPQAQRYRVSLWDIGNGTVINPSGTPKWQSDWTDNPAISYSGNPGSGNYGWEVTIDGGGAGQGRTRVRSLRF